MGKWAAEGCEVFACKLAAEGYWQLTAALNTVT